MLTSSVKRNGVVFSLANIYSKEDVYSIVMFNRVHATFRYTKKFQWSMTYGSRSRHPRYGWPQGSPDQVPISDHEPSTMFGDNTHRIIGDWGQQSC